jgi:hypothetical protein
LQKPLKFCLGIVSSVDLHLIKQNKPVVPQFFGGIFRHAPLSEPNHRDTGPLNRPEKNQPLKNMLWLLFVCCAYFVLVPCTAEGVKIFLDQMHETDMKAVNVHFVVGMHHALFQIFTSIVVV